MLRITKAVVTQSINIRYTVKILKVNNYVNHFLFNNVGHAGGTLKHPFKLKKIHTLQE